MENYQHHEKVFLSPPSYSITREKLIRKLDYLMFKEWEMRDCKDEWNKYQERDYDELLKEIKEIELELNCTL